jgi:hypothetical protein
MKHETYSCDIKDCKDTVVSKRKVPVMFDHDQEDGKSKTEPYFEMKELDLCDNHWKQMTGTRTLIYAYGAMGYNDYTLLNRSQ